MPISTAHPQRGIVDDALAFSNKGRSSLAGVVTYQTELGDNVQIVNTTLVADASEIEKAETRLMRQIAQAEMRAKCWVGDYQRCAEWMIGDDAFITIGGGAFDPVKFNREVVRTIGAEFVGNMGDATGYWRYTCPSDAEGVYYVHAFVLYRLTAGANVVRATLSPFINNNQYHIIDGVDRGYAGEAPIIDLKLNGGCLVPLTAGQVLTLRVLMATSAGSGTLTLTYPSSVFGYVSIVRTRCDMDEVDRYRNGTAIDSPVTGNTYTWT